MVMLGQCFRVSGGVALMAETLSRGLIWDSLQLFSNL